jgi:hypothetical protein
MAFCEIIFVTVNMHSLCFFDSHLTKLLQWMVNFCERKKDCILDTASAVDVQLSVRAGIRFSIGGVVPKGKKLGTLTWFEWTIYSSFNLRSSPKIAINQANETFEIPSTESEAFDRRDQYQPCRDEIRRSNHT